MLESEIRGYGTARYTREALEKVTTGARSYRVPELRRLAADRLAQRDVHVDGSFDRLRRGAVLEILASLETDRSIAEAMERDAEFSVVEAMGSTYTLRANLRTMLPVTVKAEYDSQGRLQGLATDTGAPVYREARARAIQVLRAYRLDHESVLSVSGPVDTSYGPSYTIVGTLDGEEIEVGYVFIDQNGRYVDHLTITVGADRPGDDARRTWYALVDMYRTEMLLPCSMCLSASHRPGTTGTFTDVTRLWPEHAYVKPKHWWYWTEIYVREFSWCGCGCRGPHTSDNMSALRDHADAVLGAFPLVTKVRIRTAFESPENKPSFTQECIAAGPVLETIARGAQA